MAPLKIELSFIKNEESPKSGQEEVSKSSTVEILRDKGEISVDSLPSKGRNVSSSEQLNIKNKNESKITFFMMRELKCYI